jgi:hypothetical protein
MHLGGDSSKQKQKPKPKQKQKQKQKAGSHSKQQAMQQGSCFVRAYRGKKGDSRCTTKTGCVKATT